MEIQIFFFENFQSFSKFLRVVQTQAILLLKSLLGRVGSDIERLWNWMKNFYIDSKSIEMT